MVVDQLRVDLVRQVEVNLCLMMEKEVLKLKAECELKITSTNQKT